MAAEPQSPWLAVDPSADRLSQARELERTYEAFRTGTRLDPGTRLRAVVRQSWQRSASAGAATDGRRTPIVMDEREVDDRWSSHPLHPVLPALRELLSDATTRSGHMLVISDADGVLLWIEGHGEVVDATEDMHFVCGADWSEIAAGTNALGTAIALDHPVQIFSAEHFNRIVHPWQCSGAPIHDPDTGEILGVVDLTGHLSTAHPHTLSLVTAAARMAEAFLREQSRRRDEELRDHYLARVAGRPGQSALIGRGGRRLMAVPHDWLAAVPEVPADASEVELSGGGAAEVERLPHGGFVLWRRRVAAGGAPAAVASAPVSVTLLAEHATAEIDGRVLPLRRRQAELLCVLLLASRGLTAEQLALELYGESGKAVSVRAELSRLRREVGEVVAARPYRLADRVRVDLAALQRDAESEPLHAILDRYRRPLLDGSEVAIVAEARDALDHLIRRRAIGSGDAGLLERWCRSAAGEQDQPAAELLVGLLAEDDPRRDWATAHARRLRALFSG